MLKLSDITHVLRRWGLSGFWAIVDQGLFSVSNFLVNILLARWLLPKEYGAFAVAFSIFYLLAGFHSAMLTEPMMVFGSGKYRNCFSGYIEILFHNHWRLSVVISIIVGGIALVAFRCGFWEMFHALIGLAIAAPFLLFLWLTRRACYVPMHPVWAVIGGGCNLFFVLSGLLFLWWKNWISSFSGVLLLGVAAGLSSLVIWLFLRAEVSGVEDLDDKGVYVEHMNYGRWSVSTFLLMWTSGNIYYFLLMYHGLGVSGTLKALQNFTMPAFQVFNALSLIWLYFFSRVVSSRRVWRVFWLSMFFSLFLAVIYLLVLTVGRNVINSVYANKYKLDTMLIGLLGLIVISYALARVIDSLGKALERVDLIFKAQLIAMLLGTVIMGFPLTIRFGVKGAIASQVLSHYIAIGLKFFYILKSLKRRKNG